MTFARKAAGIACAAVVFFGIVFAVGCGSTYRPIVIPNTQPQSDPQSPEAVAIINQNSSTTTPGSVTFIDVSGDDNLGVASTGLGLALASFNENFSALFVPNPKSNNITYVAQSGSGVATRSLTVDAGSDPIGIFPSSTEMYTLNSKPIPSCPSGGSVGVIDTSTATLSTEICVGKSPVWAVQAPNQNLLFVADSVENSVYVINTLTFAVQVVLPVGATPVWIQLGGVNGTYAFVLNQGDNSISVIDVANVKVLGSATPLPAGDTKPVTGLVVSAVKRFYVLNQGSETLTFLNVNENPTNSANPITFTVAAPSLKTGKVPKTVSGTSDGSFIFVANTGENTVYQIPTDPLPNDPSKCPNPADPTKCVTKVYPITSRVTNAAVRVTDVGNGTDVLNGKCKYKVYITSVTADNKDNGTTIICSATNQAVNDPTGKLFTPLVAAPCNLYVAIYDMVVGDGGSGGSLAAATYWYRVTAVDGAGGEVSLAGPDLTNNNIPSYELSVVNPGGHTDKLSWTPVQSATGYNVYRGTAKGGEVLLAANVPTPSFVDDGSLTPGAQTPPTSCTQQQPLQVAGSR